MILKVHYDLTWSYVKGHSKLLPKMGLRLLQFLKTHSNNIMKSCVRNCEYLMAYKLRRGQQAFSLYTRLWGEARFKEMLTQMRRKVIQQFLQKNNALTLTGVLMAFDWNKNRIQEKYLKSHYLDLDYIEYLTQTTMTCTKCHKRLVVDVPCENVSYCTCPDSKPVYNKKFSTTPWTPFIERQDLLVWRKEKEKNSGLYEYKLFGIYKEVRADMFLHVQIDTDYRKKWDTTAVEIKIVDHDEISNSDVIYWEMKWPKFFANRDYVFNRRYVVDSLDNVIVISNKIVEHPKVPEDPNKYRVKDYYCTMVIKPFTTFDEPGLRFCMTYFDNPGLSIPGTVQTWVATSAMPDFLTRLRKAAKECPVPPSELKIYQNMNSNFFKDFCRKNYAQSAAIIRICKDHIFSS